MESEQSGQEKVMGRRGGGLEKLDSGRESAGCDRACGMGFDGREEPGKARLLSELGEEIVPDGDDEEMSWL